MTRRFQVTLHGSGLRVPLEGNRPIRGFFAIRRIQAETPEAATRDALAALRQEERFRELEAATQRELGNDATITVQRDNIGELSWFRWHFFRHSNAFIFYTKEGDGDCCQG